MRGVNLLYYYTPAQKNIQSFWQAAVATLKIRGINGIRRMLQ